MAAMRFCCCLLEGRGLLTQVGHHLVDFGSRVPQLLVQPLLELAGELRLAFAKRLVARPQLPLGRLGLDPRLQP